MRIATETVWLLVANLVSPKFSSHRLAKVEARKRDTAPRQAQAEPAAAAEFVGEA